MTGMYSYNNFIFEISRAFDEILEETTPQHRPFEIGQILLDYKTKNNLD